MYGDVYWAINFTMDWLALWLTAKAMGQRPRPGRISMGAGLGAIYATAALLLPDGNLLSLITGLAVPLVLVALSLELPHRGGMARTLGKGVAIFYLISFLLGGAATAVSYFVAKWAKRELVMGGQVSALPADLPYWGLLLIALTVGAAISLLLRRRGKLPHIATVEIGEQEDALTSLIGLIDSGNLLTEPLSGSGVILVRREAAAFLPAELAFLREGGTPTLSPRLRLIPYSTPAGEGILYGYLPRHLRVNGRPRAACVAIAPLPPGGEPADAILPASLI